MTKLDCENQFCIYFESNKCILERNSLDESGMCKESYCVDIEEDFLSVKRKKQREKFQQPNNGK